MITVDPKIKLSLSATFQANVLEPTMSLGQTTFGLTISAPAPFEFGFNGVGIQGPQGIQGPAGDSHATVTAGQALGGHRAVVLNAADQAIYADNTNLTHIGRFAGITVGAAASGAPVTLVKSELITEPSWNWTPNAPVFLSTNGLLTQVPTTTGFQQVIGMAITSTQLFVNPRDPMITQ